jgi:single-stranded-DNA-specific exonuclease
MTTLSFPEIFDSLLKIRGIDKAGEEEFLNPDYGKLHDPLLLPDMEKARDRVIRAVRDGEHVAVFSDYDADGIPGAVVLNDFFRRAGYGNVSFYIPHRHDEGFGLNMDAVEEIASRGAKLLITIDCGVADIEEVRFAGEKGMDVIITDHHEPPLRQGSAGQAEEALPDAYAVVDPKRRGSEYPFKELCGAAVAYKLVQAVLLEERFGIKEGMEKWSLDMVGIATLSDMVPLLGENRILASFGLDVLKKSRRPGLLALLSKLRMSQKNLTEDDIAFMITPRINAASRMGTPEDAFNLLATDDESEADKLADHLEKINNERKGVVASLVKDAKKHLKDREVIRGVVVVGNPDWKPSLLGLVANSLVEEYERPAFVWGRDGDGKLKGSCRSYNGYDLHALMSSVPEMFIEFGGHQGAGGFSITLEQLANLEERLSDALDRLEKVEKEEEDSLAIQIADVGEGLWKTVSGFAPFGTGNPKPVFQLKGAVSSARQFGKEKNHLEIALKDESGREVRAISFFSSPENFNTPLSVGAPVTLCANLEKSYFRNQPELRLRIVDIN